MARTSTSIEISAEREVNDGWISPLIWIGLALAVLGVIAVLSAIIDIRPLQERVESWTTKRSRLAADGSPRPGSRRERRLAGSTLPEVDLDQTEVDLDQTEADLDQRGEES